MNSLELADTDWLGHGWLLILAFTAATLMVVALRKSCRRLFGAERAFQLWLLPPLAMLVSQLPHAAVARVTTLPTVVFAITSAAGTLPSHASSSAAFDWRTGIALIWIAGVAIALLLAVLAQLRYRARLHGATPVVEVSSRWPVLRASGTDVGPALVGAWRIRIVLPADFEQRYDAAERSLILAHESMHACRRDGWWCLLAQAVAAVFWFHPLVWWAQRAFRQDQELACDAAVLREHGEQRRTYANAMLKTQSATFVLPIGCSWSPRHHPLTERIAMLKLSTPSRNRRFAGLVSLCVAIAGLTSMVYASSQPMAKSKPEVSPPPIFQLAMSLNRGGATLGTPTVCTKAGEPAGISMRDKADPGKPVLALDLTVKPVTATDVRVAVKGSVRASDGRVVELNLSLRGVLGSPMTVKVGDEKGAAPLMLTVTPSRGCTAASENART